MYPASKTSPWSHQVEALGNALKHEGYMIAHDMGAGKSKTGVDFCTAVNAHRVLIICPKSVIPVWPRQFAWHAGVPFRVIPLTKGTVAEKAHRLATELLRIKTTKERLVIVVNYESAWREPLGPIYGLRKRIVKPGTILSHEWDVVILDESHRIKAPGGAASWFCAKLRPKAIRRLCLTGTPMPHDPLDIYAQYRFLDPSIYGLSFARFKRRYAITGGFENKQVVAFQNLDELHELFYRIAHRVTKDEVLDLPDIIHEHIAFDLTGKTQSVYGQLESEFVAEVESGEVTAANAMVKLLRLQQVTGGQIKLDSGDLVNIGSEKLDALADLLEDLPVTEPVIIFCRFTNEILRIKALCEKLGRPAAELSGKANDLEAWQLGDHNAIVVQIRAGGLGIDLTRARYIIYYSLGFSLGDYEQSLARAHRPGQTRKVAVYHLTASGTVDQKVYKALRAKKQVVETVLQGFKNRDKEEVGYGDDQAVDSRERAAPPGGGDRALGFGGGDRRQERERQIVGA